LWGEKQKKPPYRVEIDDPFQGNPTPYQHARAWEITVPTLPSFKYEVGGHRRPDEGFVSNPVPSLHELPGWLNWTTVDPIP
jgi:hypothetical protein